MQIFTDSYCCQYHVTNILSVTQVPQISILRGNFSIYRWPEYKYRMNINSRSILTFIWQYSEQVVNHGVYDEDCLFKRLVTDSSHVSDILDEME